MKKILVFAMLFLCWNREILAQPIDSVAVRLLMRQNQELLLRLTQNNERMNKLTDSLKQAYNTIGQHEMDLQKADAGLRQFRTRLEINEESRYRIIRNNLLYSFEFFEILNDKLNTLEAFNQLETYQGMLLDLNNPASESMGFSYNKKVMQLLDANIPPVKKKSRYLDFAKVLLENPVVKGVTSLTPVLNIGSSVFSYVTALSANEDKITPENLSTLKKDLDKYTNYYVSLNNANHSFNTSLTSFKVSNTNLHNKLYEFVIKNLMESGFNPKENINLGADNSSATQLTYLFSIYNREAAYKYLDDIERKYTEKGKINYGKILENNTQLVNMNKRTNEVITLYKDFEYLFGQYMAMLEKNNKDMIAIMEQAAIDKLSDTPAMVTQQVEKLKVEKRKGTESIQKAINMPKMKVLIDKLDTFYPAM
jgi:hypothetical protein